MDEAVIRVEGLEKAFPYKKSMFSKEKSEIRAVDDVSLTVRAGEIMGLVGESGSGKTTLARVILGLTPPTAGKVEINGMDIAGLGHRRMKALRRDIAVVFQDPSANLNPRQTVGSSLMRPMRIHGVGYAQAKERAALAIEKVKLDPQYMNSYPHQLSGGQLQRVAVARALVLQPKVMVLDEPTSALDISIQAQVLNLLLDLQQEMGLTYLIITHDLNVIRYISDRLAVMYLGKLVEYGDSEAVFGNPAHPYTQGLLSAAPVTHPAQRAKQKRRLAGEPGSLMHVGAGCRLADRCPLAEPQCKTTAPAMYPVSENHRAACHLLCNR